MLQSFYATTFGTSTLGVSFGAGFLGVTLAALPQPVQRHFPKPFGSSLNLPVSAFFTDSFMPARGLRAGNEQHAEIYSYTFSRRGAAGLAIGLLLFAHRARFSFRDDPFGFCAPLPDVDFV